MHAATDDRVLARLLDKIDASGVCWEWTASRNAGGYGQFRVARSMRGAHRVAYTLLVGPVPAGLDLDHLCRNRACVNPDHLQPVTRQTNIRRGSSLVAGQARQTHCLRGHPFDGVNSYVSSRGKRECRACIRRKVREQRANGVRYDRKKAQP
jgi:hypothetical protein